MSDIKNYIKNGRLSDSGRIITGSNAPAGSRAIQKNIWANATATFYETVGKYATNVFDAEIQGLDYDNFYAWRKVKIRSAIISDPTTGNELTPNWQKIVVLDKDIDFIPAGAYVKYNNAIWLVFNPDTVASEIATAIVQRCNATFNVYDYYGNIVQIPLVYTKSMTLSAEPFYHQYNIMPDGYEHVLMQYNKYTKEFVNNTRIILGKSAFVLTGIVDFAEDFTGNENSIHMLRADVRATDTVENDDIPNKIADAKGFTFELNIGGNKEMSVGETEPLSSEVVKNGEVLLPTEEYPLTLYYESSDPEIIQVNSDGTITAVAEGECDISVKLKENPDKVAKLTISVTEATEADYISFTSVVPETIVAYDTVTLKAVFYEDGIATEEPIVFAIKGASYIATNNTVMIQAMGAGQDIVLTAMHGNVSKTIHIKVNGF